MPLGFPKNQPSALQMAGDDPVLLAAVRRSRKLLHKRALVAAAAGAVPIPGLDWAVDAALLSNMIPEINAEFGLTKQQIDKLDPHKREKVQKAVALVGSMLVGRVVTKDLVLKAAKVIGLRLTTQQAVKYVPLAGQAAAAAIGYAAIRHLGEQHLRDCVQISRSIAGLLEAPTGQAPPSATLAH